MLNENVADTNLNSREKAVLASIIQYPSQPDIEVATKIKMKHSTFATIKKRLQNKGYFFRIYLPNFAGFGAEIFSINIQTFANDPRVSKSIELKADKIDDYLQSSPNLLFSIIENNLTVTLSCYTNFRQFQNDIWRYDNAILESELNSIFQHELQIPIVFSEFPRFLDYSKSIIKHLGVKNLPKGDLSEFHFKEIQTLKLSDLSRRILEGFLEAPGRTPKDVSEITGKSRTTTSRWLKKFLDSGLITPRYIPNVEKIGYKIVLLSHYSINSSQRSDFAKAITNIDNTLTPILLMRSECDIILAAVFRSYDSAKEAEQVLISQMNWDGLSYSTKYRYLLSLPHTVTKFNFMDKPNQILSEFLK